ncbi:MAG: hypothetical protein FJX60_20580 [Alphaproteobacteria bacterium]|nr:hypothetical protein [Alphaproteobacteria bacterium]
MTLRDLARAEILSKSKPLCERARELRHLRLTLPLTTAELDELEILGRAQKVLAEAEAAVMRIVPKRLASWDAVRRLIEEIEAANRELRQKVRDADDVAGNVEAAGDLTDAVDTLIGKLILLLARLA